MYVCCCTGVTDTTIRAAIEAGATSIEEITRCTRAGSRCGSCRPEIADMLAAAGVAIDRAELDAPNRSRVPPPRRVHLAVAQPTAEHEGDRSAA
jgi:bacterioferritin-associated ferredoxin